MNLMLQNAAQRQFQCLCRVYLFYPNIKQKHSVHGNVFFFQKRKELFFSLFVFICYSPPVTSFSLRRLLFLQKLLRSRKCASRKWTRMCDDVKHFTKLWRSIFNILKQQRDNFQFGRRLFFYLEMDRFLPIIGDKSRKSDLNGRVWLNTRV